MRQPSWRTKDRLAKVAAIYRAAVEAGHPPTQAVADRLGISHTAAANLVAKARRHGALTVTAWDDTTRQATART